MLIIGNVSVRHGDISYGIKNILIPLFQKKKMNYFYLKFLLKSKFSTCQAQGVLNLFLCFYLFQPLCSNKVCSHKKVYFAWIRSVFRAKFGDFLLTDHECRKILIFFAMCDNDNGRKISGVCSLVGQLNQKGWSRFSRFRSSNVS